MNTALTYISASIGLALIFSVLGIIANKPRREPNVFTYPKKFVWVLFGGVPLLIMFGIIIAVVSPSQSWKWPVASAAVWTAFVLSYTFLCCYVRYYFVRLIGNQIQYGSIGLRRSVILMSVRRFVIIQGGDGVRFLELYDANNRRLLRVADTVQDFDELADAIREQLPKHEVTYESRDKWGKWTRRPS